MDNQTAPRDYHREIIKLIKEAAYSTDTYQVFNDFVEMSAITISNTVDPTHREEREKRYLERINAYDKRYQDLFPQMFACLVEALEHKVATSGPEDVLGRIYHELELHRKEKAQYFTPQHVSDMMALLACGDEHQSAIEERGYISVCEPTCGSGVMVTSFCKAMLKEKLNYCTQLVVTAIDVALSCAYMTYIQLSLYGVPAVVIHGNSITCQEYSRWYTPVYLLNGWIWREPCGMTSARSQEDEMIKCALEPAYAALRMVEGMMAAESVPDATAAATDPITAPVVAPVTVTTAPIAPPLATPAAPAGESQPFPPFLPNPKKSKKTAPEADGQISLFGEVF
jgi:hypothetical protein